MSASTDYATYLRIDELLTLQHPLTEGAHDEMLFIVVHQAYELWFKLILHELDRASSALQAVDAPAAIAPLRRTAQVEELLIHQLRVLETMSPDGFLQFRDPLAPASGFQSSQFREIEFLSGGGDRAHLNSPAMAGRYEALIARADAPSLWDALCTCLRGLGFPVADDGERLATLVDLYRDHATADRMAVHTVCELLVDHDEVIARWRYHHALMAAREIGRRTGTGGSPGVRYLDQTLQQRFFPELWEVRSRL